MTGHNPTHDAAVDVRRYLTIFGALLALTVATVGASYLRISTAPAVALGLSIACVKAALVATFFMHLRHERAIVRGAVGLTVFLAAFLFVFTLWTEADKVPGTRFDAPFTASAPADAATEGAH